MFFTEQILYAYILLCDPTKLHELFSKNLLIQLKKMARLNASYKTNLPTIL